jgi:hypothetical protein
MIAITDVQSLELRIHALEHQLSNDKLAVQNEVKATLNKLKPINLIKSMFQSAKDSPELLADLKHGIIGIATGFFTNKLLLSSVKGPVKTILAALVQAGVTNAAVRYPETIKHTGISLITKFLKSIRLKTDDRTDDRINSQHISGGAVL